MERYVGLFSVTQRNVLKILGCIVVFIFLCILVLGIRLSVKPLRLNDSIVFFESLLTKNLHLSGIELQDVLLRYDYASFQLYVSIDKMIVQRTENFLCKIDDSEFVFNIWHLISGKTFLPEIIEAKRVIVEMSEPPSGEITDIKNIVKSNVSVMFQDYPWRYVREIVLSDIVFAYPLAVNDIAEQTEASYFFFERNDSFLSVDIQLNMVLDDHVNRVHLVYSESTDTTGTLILNVDNLKLSALRWLWYPLSALDVVMTGHSQFVVDTQAKSIKGSLQDFNVDTRSQKWRFDGNLFVNEAQSGFIVVSDLILQDETIPEYSGNISFILETNKMENVLHIKEFNFIRETSIIKFMGDLLYKNADIFANIKGEIRDWKVDNLKKLSLIKAVSPKLYHWVNLNIYGGYITDGQFKIAISPEEFLDVRDTARDDKDNIEVFLNVVDTQIRYFKSMPQIHVVKGNVLFLDDHLVVHGDGFHVFEGNKILHVKEIYVDYPYQFFSYNNVQVRGVIEGDMGALCYFINGLSIDDIDNLHIISDTCIGEVSGDIQLILPKVKNITLQQVQLSSQLMLENVQLDIMDKYQVLTHDAVLNVTPQYIRMDAPIVVNGVSFDMNYHHKIGQGQEPIKEKAILFLSGEADGKGLSALGFERFTEHAVGNMRFDVTLIKDSTFFNHMIFHADLASVAIDMIPFAYTKPIGVESQLSLEIDWETPSYISNFTCIIKGENIAVDAHIVLEKGVLKDIQIAPFDVDDSYHMVIQMNHDQPYPHIDITGSVLEGTFMIPYLKEIFYRDPLHILGNNFTMNIAIDKLIMDNDVYLSNFSASMKLQNHIWENIILSGLFQDESIFDLILIRGEEDIRYFSLEVPVASHLLHALGNTKHIKEGYLSINTMIYDQGDRVIGEGYAYMVNFDLYNISFIDIMSLFSPIDLFHIFSKKGVFFSGINITYKFDKERFQIQDLLMHSNAFGLTAEGFFTRDMTHIDVMGDIIPVYSVNDFIKRMPVIGALLGSRDQKGIVGIQYHLTGSVTEPDVFINPFSIAIPTAIRDFVVQQISSFSDTH